ncbi:MAG: NAD(P)/FAD-dependent oxidoreductase [Chloroflexi bacterium]|nr:NAD(P)/FAD-dependent oxidoreductase [Chloroflexota bacterium]
MPITHSTQNNEDRPIIIGGGPAGMTCALQLHRYGLKPILLEKRELGGLLWNANLVENYPGFPNGVRGEKLIALMKKQIERIGVEVKREEVTRIDWKENHFEITTKYREASPWDAIRNTQYLILATGTKSRPLPDTISPEASKRVFTEVWPLAEVTDKQIVIVGAGDAAFDYAINLVKKRNFVTILNRGETVKCLPLLFERAAREPQIQYFAKTNVSQIAFVKSRKSKVTRPSTFDFRLRIDCETETFEADYVLYAIGRVPNVDYLSEEICRRENELVEAGHLYFIGDVKNDLFRQVAIAAGDGLRAAMEIFSRMTK